jgi:hypothetical protein
MFFEAESGDSKLWGTTNRDLTGNSLTRPTPVLPSQSRHPFSFAHYRAVKYLCNVGLEVLSEVEM